MVVNTFPAQLVEAKMISPSVKHFVFKLDNHPPFDYQPGQFITIHFDHEGKNLKRSYSIANVPQQNNRIEFAAGFVADGPGTQLLFNLEIGDAIQINGPFGRLVLKEDAFQRIILVATSTGVTPYRAMLGVLSERLQQNPALQVIILLGVQYSKDVLYKDEFIKFAESFPNQVVFRAQLSREPNDSLCAYEYSGYVQHSFTELNVNPLSDIVYLCGNPMMVDEAFTQLKEKGFAMQQIIREKYISR